MTRYEENARTIISNSLKLNITIVGAINLWVLDKNTEPVLTDNECIDIAINYPYSWQSIRDCFIRRG